MELREYYSAKRLFEETLQGLEKSLGNGHKKTLRSRHRLAATQLILEKYTETENHFRETLRCQQKLYGDEHRYTLSSRQKMTQTLFQLKKHSEAEEHFRQTLILRENIMGDKDFNTLSSGEWLAKTLKELSRHAEADQLLQTIWKSDQAMLSSKGKSEEDVKYDADDMPLSLVDHDQLGNSLLEQENSAEENDPADPTGEFQYLDIDVVTAIQATPTKEESTNHYQIDEDNTPTLNNSDQLVDSVGLRLPNNDKLDQVINADALPVGFDEALDSETSSCLNEAIVPLTAITDITSTVEQLTTLNELVEQSQIPSRSYSLNKNCIEDDLQQLSSDDNETFLLRGSSRLFDYAPGADDES